jgi:hypothetical protein
MIFLTSCTLTIGDTYNCSGQCSNKTEECSTNSDSTVTDEVVNEIPENTEYEIIEE